VRIKDNKIVEDPAEMRVPIFNASIGSQCRLCGGHFGNEGGLAVHLTVCSVKQEARASSRDGVEQSYADNSTLRA